MVQIWALCKPYGVDMPFKQPNQTKRFIPTYPIP